MQELEAVIDDPLFHCRVGQAFALKAVKAATRLTTAPRFGARSKHVASNPTFPTKAIGSRSSDLASSAIESGV